MRRHAIPVLVAAACALLTPVPAQERPSPDDVRWLEEHSMLHQSGVVAKSLSGQGAQWRHPYAKPQPREAVRRAPVWFLDYAGSVVPRPGKSVIATWAEPDLWSALRELGVDLLHTGPVKRAGGVRGREFTPTLDGWFDPISLEIDPALGTEDE